MGILIGDFAVDFVRGLSWFGDFAWVFCKGILNGGFDRGFYTGILHRGCGSFMYGCVLPLLGDCHTSCDLPTFWGGFAFAGRAHPASGVGFNGVCQGLTAPGFSYPVYFIRAIHYGTLLQGAQVVWLTRYAEAPFGVLLRTRLCY